MTATAEIAPGITVEYVEHKHHHIIYKNGVKQLYVVCHGMRREGEMWVVLDGGYAQLMELRGTDKDAAIARAVAMLRDGTIFEEQRARLGARVQATRRIYEAMAAEEAAKRDPRNWGVVKLTKAIEQKRAQLHQLTFEIRDLEELLLLKKKRKAK